MSRLLAVIACATLAMPAFGYSFHLRVTDGRTSMLAKPDAHWPEEQLERAAISRVLSFERVQGAHFDWMMLGWPEGKQDVAYAINDRGGAKDVETADLTLAPQESGVVTTTCHRSRCSIHITDGGDRRVDATLVKGQSADLPLGADWDVEVEP